MVKKFTIPFASQGDANDIPDALQVDGKVSFTQGFSYDYERPYDDPQAKDIAREDMNGLFKAITSAVGELQTLGASEWSSAISYPKGAIVYYEKDLYISQVDDNQNTPPQNWVSITSIANDSLKKAANLSDLTNKATARSNLGLGSSATLNKTDVLGTSTSLVATQKLVNDTKINLESSKQDKLTFTGTGNVARMSEVEKKRDINNVTFANPMEPYIQLRGTEITGAGARINITNDKGTLRFVYRDQSSVDNHHVITVRKKSGDVALTSELPVITQSTGSSTTSVMSQKAVTDESSKNTPIGTIQAFIGENAPSDKWLLCRGQAFSAGSYPDLAQLLPDLKIPDLRGVALRGLDANRGFDPSRVLLSYQEDAMQKITGGVTQAGGSSLFWTGSPASSGAFKSLTGSVNVANSEVQKLSGRVHTITFDSSLTSRSNTQNETVMKNVAINFIIKAR